ncbi:MAG: gliding motility protein GldN [Bacteroidetes bacterium MED-G13]|nr:gliding motility protein GldN [Flavobacteriaceae bacterium]PDH47773.1 MAG: gliding motility protein GldN [Bacteroidetes bacterium MED-G13]|tara:strand:+ start:10457 stop:11584 length:1128 start_codon:yes stop_codon:yes gene_type:complete
MKLMRNKYLILFILVISICFETFSQVNILNAKDPADIGVRDDMQIRQDEDQKLEYGYVDDRDILFSKVIWEVIDLDQRVNFPYLYPIDTMVVGKERRPLIYYLLKGIERGDITKIYDDGKFNNKITYDDFVNKNTDFQGLSYREINRRGRDVIDTQASGSRNFFIMNNEIPLGAQYDSIADLDEYFSVLSFDQQYDETKKDELQAYENTRDTALMDWFQENYGDKYVDTYEFTYDMIDHYKIKGIWYFDKRIAELKYRPLAIAPVARQVLNKKEDAGLSPEERTPPVEMFWIYYPDARNVLKDSYVFSDRNSVVRKSFDELINARRFHTMIYLEENMYEDRKIGEYITDNAFQRLLESERIKEKIRNFEHDMWSW